MRLLRITILSTAFLSIVMLGQSNVKAQVQLTKINQPQAADFNGFSIMPGSENYTKGQVLIGSGLLSSTRHSKNLCNTYSFSLKSEGSSRILSVQGLDGQSSVGKQVTLLEEEEFTIMGKSKGVIITKNSGEECFGFDVLDNQLSLKINYPFISGGFQNALVSSNDNVSVMLGQDMYSFETKLKVIDNNLGSVILEKEFKFEEKMVMDIEITSTGYVMLVNDLNAVNSTLIFYDQSFSEIDKVVSSKRVYNNRINYDNESNSLLVQYAGELQIFGGDQGSTLLRSVDVMKIVGEKPFMELKLNSVLAHDGSILFFLKPWEQYPSKIPTKIIGIGKDSDEILFKSDINLTTESVSAIHKTENKIMILNQDKIDIYEY